MVVILHVKVFKVQISGNKFANKKNSLNISSLNIDSTVITYRNFNKYIKYKDTFLIEWKQW